MEFLQNFVQSNWTSKDSLKEILFDKQLDCLRDKSTFVAALCTRRAGKSYLAGVRLYLAALTHPNSISIYIALTRTSARNIMWQILLNIATKAGIEIEPKESSLTIKIRESNSEIHLVGADTKNFIERLRGIPYAVAIIDEAGFFRDHISLLVDDVLEPSISDYNGQIVLLGTPAVRPQGLFYDATMGKTSGWSVHRWSVFDNPHMPNQRDFVDKMMIRRGWTKDNPTYLREWCGQWVEDLDALVYKYKKEKNDYRELPTTNDWTRILAVDYGWHDKTAFAVVAYHPKVTRSYIEHAKGYSELIPSQIADMLQKLIVRFNPVKIVADTGGLGKSITEEMRIRYQIPIVAASKTDKHSFISLMNGEFIDGNLLVNEKLEELRHQYSTLVKDEHGDEDPNMPNDLCDAALYAWRESKNYQATPDIVYQSQEEKINAEAMKYWEEQSEELEKKETLEWWEN
jgi:hypothetical protein